MPIKSYIALAHDGQCDKMIEDLVAIPECEVTVSTNREVVLLVTETPNETVEGKLKKRLESIPSLKFLTMVAGYATA